LERYLQDDPVIVVLDDIDQIPQRERNSLIYNLLTLGNIGLICITGSMYPLLALHEKIHSRLNARRIKFQPYTHSDLLFLLKQRAQHALASGSWNEDILSKIAELSSGDARVAIQTLSSSAMLAEHALSGSIDHKHIRKAFNGIKDLKRIFCLRNLSEHHQLLYEIIKQRGEILSQDLREEYEKRCKQKNYEAMARRTTDNYLNIDLITAKLITRRRAKMRGKVFIYSVKE
jgi:Cdc6-like AAA superfamily ATPase